MIETNHTRSPVAPGSPTHELRQTRPRRAGPRAIAGPLVALLIALTGCVPAPAGQDSSPSSRASSAGAGTTTPVPEHTAARDASEQEKPTQQPPDLGAGKADDSGRYRFVCASTINVPDLVLSSLGEVWANPGYLRLRSCTVRYAGEEPFEPTEGEAYIISIAAPQVPPADGLDDYLHVLSLCTRVSDEAAVLGTSSSAHLHAAAALCPDGPQGAIIAEWANGKRVGDGTHTAGTSSLIPGRYYLRTTPPEDCSWTITGTSGQVRARGGSSDGRAGIILAEGERLASSNCGTWEQPR